MAQNMADRQDSPDTVAVRCLTEFYTSRIAQIQNDILAAGKTARVGYVDTYSAMDGRQGLLLIERRHGFTGAFEFEIHPTNGGHTVIAAAFEGVWRTLQ